MNEIRVVGRPLGGATMWVCEPGEICLGGASSSGVEQLRVLLPDAWQGLSVRLTFLPAGRTPVAVVLPSDGIVDITNDITGGRQNRGEFLLDAAADGVAVYTTAGSYYVYGHPKAGGIPSKYTPDAYQQFVALVKADADRAAAAAAEASAAGESVSGSVSAAEGYAREAAAAASSIGDTAERAEAAASSAEAHAVRAEAAKGAVQQNAEAAAASAASAEGYAAAAASEASAAGSSAAAAAESKNAAASSAGAAASSAGAAAGSASEAAASAESIGNAEAVVVQKASEAAESASSAASSADRAEAAATQAEQIAGGDFATKAELSAGLAGKVDAEAGKGLSSNDYTDTEKQKLTGIEAGANNYSHPATHPASMITGLGDAAAKNVGTASGTVAAGNHGHAGVYDPAGSAAAVQDNLDAHARDGSIHHKIHQYSVTLTAVGWNSSTKQQTVNVTGVTDTYPVIVSYPPGSANKANKEALMDAEVEAISQAAGTVTFECSTIPSSNLTVLVEVIT